MLKKALLLMSLLLPSLSQAALVEGKDYVVLAAPQPVTTPGKIEVIEFFSYSCIHCANLEPALEAWSKKQPADVSFRRQQVVWGSNMEGLARLHTTVKSLGLESRLNRAIFGAMLEQRVNMAEAQQVSSWVAKQPGIDAAKFMQTYRSFGVNASVAQAAKQTRDYRVEGTPALVVAGKYQAKPAEPARLLQVVNELIAKARAEKRR